MRSGPRRGVVLLAVLVIVTIGALVGSTIMYLAGAERAAAEASLRRTQARAMAWSGVQAVMAELAAQREKLLDGERPEITASWTMFEPGADGGVRGVVRIVKAAGTETAIVPEAGKLDLNTMPVEVLERLDLLKDGLAGRIVAARAGRPLGAVEELAGVEGVTPELLSGRGPEPESGLGSAASTARPDAPRGGGGISGTGGAADPESLADALTVFSFDPAVQVGLGANGSGSRGKRRVNLNIAWSDRLGRAIQERFDAGAAEQVKKLMDGGVKFGSDAEIVQTLRKLGVPLGSWGEVLDSLTTSDEPYRYGRVDLNTASAAVLACLPGIDRSTAEAIVQARSRVDTAARRSIAWPAVEGAMKPEQLAAAVNYLTTRTMQWRVRVEAGFVRAEHTGPGVGGSGAEASGRSGTAGGAREQDAAELRGSVVLEAVIDVASQRPRVAYLRDVTMLGAAAALASLNRAEDGGAARTSLEGDAPEEPEPETMPGSERMADPEADAPETMPGPGVAVDPPVVPEPPASERDRRLGRWTPGGTGQAGGSE